MAEDFKKANAGDLERLHRMLHKVAGDDLETLRRRLASRDEARILDIACGECREAEVLTDFMAEIKGAPDSTVKLTGIDVRAREIADAQKKFGSRRGPDSKRGKREFEFLTGDATKLQSNSEMGEDFDLVFMRHQNYWNGDSTWEKIFDQALEKLGKDGRLVITSYFDKEHSLALKALQRLGGELIRTEFNAETRELITPGKSVDRHIAIFKRKDG